MYIDPYALIVQQDGDGGDTLQREGMYAFGKWMRYDQANNTVVITEPDDHGTPEQNMEKLEIAPGVYVRHPDPTRWYSNPDTTSRDQLIPVIAYCAAYQDYPRLWRLFKATAMRGFFAQNLLRIGDDPQAPKVPDTWLGHLGLFIRAGGWWTAPLYPLLFVTDSIDLAGTILAVIPIHYEERTGILRLSEPRDVDDNNTIIGHLMALRFKPTPISWLNRQVYALTRPVNYGNLILGETNPVMGALAWYHRSSAGGNPEIAELYRPLIEEYFSPQDPLATISNDLARLFEDYSQRILTTSL
jgi:hypothetical protein